MSESLDLLITVRAQLDQLVKGQEELRKFKQEATGPGQALKPGFGVDVVRRGIDLLKSTVREFGLEAFRMADSIKDSSQNLGLSTDAYQVLGNVLKDAGGDIGMLTMAISQNNRSLVEARGYTTAAAGAYRTLRLDIAELEAMPVEKRMEMYGRAVANSTDKQAAFSAATQILGSRNLPTLLGALKDLAADGYEKVEAAAKKAGRVMENDTIARLDRAQKAIDKLKQAATIATGEMIAGVGGIADSAKKSPFGTAWDLTKTFISGNPEYLIPTAIRAKQAEPKETKPNLDDGGAAARLLALTRAQILAEDNLAMSIMARQSLEADPNESEFAKRERRILALQKEIVLRKELIYSTGDQPSGGEGQDTKEQHELKLFKLRQQNIDATNELIRLEGQRDEQDRNTATRERFNKFQQEGGAGGGTGLGESAGLGAMDWVVDLGSQGQQVADALQSSLGATVSGISDGIYGWITGTKDFGASMLQLGGTVFKTFLNTIIQMGVQWLVTQTMIKMGMITTETVSDALRIKRMAATKVEGAQAAAAHAPGAAAASISSFGAAAILGIVALIAAMAMFGGFETGGYTPGGPSNRAAGVVHAGEWVAPQWMVNDEQYAPLIATLESARQGQPGYFLGGVVGALKSAFFDPMHPDRMLKAQLLHPPGTGMFWKKQGASVSALTGMPLPVDQAATSSSAAVAFDGAAAGGSGSGARDTTRNTYLLLDRDSFSRAMQEDSTGYFREIVASEMRRS